MTPPGLAVVRNDVDVMKLLLKAGADVNLKGHCSDHALDRTAAIAVLYAQATTRIESCYGPFALFFIRNFTLFRHIDLLDCRCVGGRTPRQ